MSTCVLQWCYLPPDDEGCAKGATPVPRARQNVLLELGYFLGRLGRDKVFALKRGTVEILSDFAGVVWEAMGGSKPWAVNSKPPDMPSTGTRSCEREPAACSVFAKY
ncbi:TIR domain-containing protein [Pseudomonas syringae]|uniref:TIR domain-containing protein n=1 Tax=Pseudomonas syringae TaxID=317 RepID=UPI0032198C73